VVSLRELALHRGMSVRYVERRVNVINDWGYSDPLSPFGRFNPQPLFGIMDIYYYGNINYGKSIQSGGIK
jgi:hypothetical protein